MSKSCTIKLTFNTSTGTYSLSGGDSNITISSDGLSYIFKGTTYTPTVNKSSSTTRYLNSYSFPSASTVGVDSASGTLSQSGLSTSSYTTSEINYYTANTEIETSSTSLSISLDSSTGSVSGDTSYCSYSTTSTKNYYFATCSYTGLGTIKSSSGGAGYTYMTVNLQITAEADSYSISVDSSTGEVYGDTSYFSYSVTYSETYSFDSVSWDSSYANYTYSSSSTSSTSSTATYTKTTSSTTYDHDMYISWTYNNGSSSFTYRNYDSSVYNNVTQYFEYTDTAVTTYSLTSTTWNNPTSLTASSTSSTSITLTYNTLEWSYTDKDGNTSTGDTIVFVDKDGNSTTITEL